MKFTNGTHLIEVKWILPYARVSIRKIGDNLEWSIMTRLSEESRVVIPPDTSHIAAFITEDDPRVLLWLKDGKIHIESHGCGDWREV